jgi:hypothetical protein
LWDRYTARRAAIAEEMGEMVPEKRLFHGTGYADNIVAKGFDVNHANANGMFGKGNIFIDIRKKNFGCFYLCSILQNNFIKTSHNMPEEELL